MKILLVDDDPACLGSMKALLTTAGHAVSVADSGPGAIAIAAVGPLDLLVVDWDLGAELSGLQVAAEAQAIHPNIQTILVSGHPSAERELRLSTLPRVKFLAKPFAIDTLVAQIEALANET